MTVMGATLQAMQEVLGLEEMDKHLDLLLWESGLVDSLSFVTLIARIEELISVKINLKDMKTNDFKCIRSIVDAISDKTGKN
ncbi:MAG: acyl carrier protein [Clostridiaceae bacterium]|nr:acyl carrier protein [Clostridiaceae bacterium]